MVLGGELRGELRRLQRIAHPAVVLGVVRARQDQFEAAADRSEEIGEIVQEIGRGARRTGDVRFAEMGSACATCAVANRIASSRDGSIVPNGTATST